MGLTMKADNWFQRELKLINPLYFAQYNDKTKKWGVRKWRSKFHTTDWRTESDIVMAVKYPALDARTLHDLKRGLYQVRRLKYLIREIDEHNKRNSASIDSEDALQHKDAARDIHKYFKSNTIDLGGTHKAKSVVHY